MFRSLVSVAMAGVLVAACATPETRGKYEAALENCLASPDVTTSNECRKAELLREQIEFEREEHARIGYGLAAVGAFALATVAILDNDCCFRSRGYYYHRPYKHKHFRHRGGKFHHGGHRKHYAHRGSWKK